MTQKSHGFTLIEVLVALVIMSIMAVMAWQGIDGIVRTRDISQTRLEQILRLNTVLSQWDQDLASFQDTGILPESPLSCDGASVRFARRAPGGVQLVVWSLRPQGNSNALVRWASPVVTQANALQENWMRSKQLQGDEPGTLRTLTGLSTWQVYFFLDSNWANCQSTGDQAADGSNPPPGKTISNNGAPPTPPEPPGNPAVAAPKGVRVVLGFAQGDGLGGSITRDSQLNR
jgi:general secretion pathway protein J